MEPTKTISLFDGEYAFLSNFYPCQIFYEYQYFPSAEHAYQMMKTIDGDWRYKIKTAKHAGMAKKIGKMCPLRTDWNKVKVTIMREIVRRKFCQNTDLTKKLIKTYPCELIEGNSWNDKFWGVCNGEGKNILGLILMELRTSIMIDIRNDEMIT